MQVFKNKITRMTFKITKINNFFLDNNKKINYPSL